MVSKAQFEKIALSFEGVEKGSSYGKPSFLLAKKFFTRLRAEDGSIVLFVGSIDEREMLMEVEPAIFHVTAHYKDYPMVLARMAKLDANTLRGMLQRRWAEIAPKKLVRGEIPGGPAGATSSKAGRRKTSRKSGG
jgi:hypothetical protein